MSATAWYNVIPSIHNTPADQRRQILARYSDTEEFKRFDESIREILSLQTTTTECAPDTSEELVRPSVVKHVVIKDYIVNECDTKEAQRCPDVATNRIIDEFHCC